MGLGHFPTPHPDELLYSLCARFSARVGYSNAKVVLQELFGTRDAAATIELPNKLGHLSAALPAGSSLTPERLISQHTLLPFFSAFLPPERVMQLEADMRGGRGQAGYMRSGLMASRVPTPRSLRFCPVCTQEGRRRFGEPYWCRTHQISGVEVCPTHGVFLEESSVSRRAGRDTLQFIAAEEAARALPPRRIESSDPDHQALLQVARDVAWLLEHPILGSELSGLHSRYLRLLTERGLATLTGRIHVTPLLSEFTGYYSPALLQLLRCEFTGSDPTKTNWLLKLVRPPKHSQHPLYHLLLIQFLGCNVEEFFQLPEGSGPFREGPWPCLNPAADHYRLPVIPEYQMGDRLRHGRPTGKFSCECGFAYVRTGPDDAPEDKFRVGRVISFGRIWETELKQLWRDSSLSISEVGRRLGVDPLTVRRHAARLKLTPSRLGSKSKPLDPAARLKGSHSLTTRAEKRRACRAVWLAALRQAPKPTFKALRRKHPREYAWLLRNDPEWLKSHSLRRGRPTHPTSGVDWKKRDAEYAVAIRAAATRLRNNPGRPLRVTRTAVGKAAGAVTLLHQKLHKMPLTAQALADVIETRAEYAARRVRWASECFTGERIMPRPWQLVLRANVYHLRDVPEVKAAVGTALRLIESNLSHPQRLTA